MLTSLLGGVGLILLGMRLLSNGLRHAAGRTIRTMLVRYTSTPVRGLISGFLITALLQSSSAVTVATIGFVNAGLMELRQVISLIYGSNIGTTMTAWLVALLGFKVNIKLFALPAIGLGMIFHMIRGEDRTASIGEALAGFGLFFLGIDLMKTAFESGASAITVSDFIVEGYLGVILAVGIGFLMTLLMQSSSAALALVLTATGGGVIPIQDAAAMVIGANVGTTSTAALAVINATSNARRVAAAHVIFNLITAGVALIILPLMLGATDWVTNVLHLDPGDTTVLAVFHSMFNVLGVALLWPFTGRLVIYLQRRFVRAEEDEARPKYLDRNIATTPLLAMEALGKEQQRLGDVARRMFKSAMSIESATGSQLPADMGILRSLVEASVEFSTLVQRSHLAPDLDDMLPTALRISRYYLECGELSVQIEELQSRLEPIDDQQLAHAMSGFKHLIVELIDYADIRLAEFSEEELDRRMETLQHAYQQLKSHLLRAGSQGSIAVRAMVDQLELYSNIRRAAEQVEKAARHLHSFTRALSGKQQIPGQAD